MGWGDCGDDSKGRPIGYVFPAICDEVGCEKEIHRGLSYACGDMHGETEWGCEKYFCEEHRRNLIQDKDETLVPLCKECYSEILRIVKEHPEDGLYYDDDEGVVIEKCQP